MTDSPRAKPSGVKAYEPKHPGGFLAPFGVTVDAVLLEQALTHRSWSYENGWAAHNERLEFLGDAVLGFAVTDRLYRDFPKLKEGDLAKRRAAIVSTQALAQTARRIGLGPYLKLGKGERATGGESKDSILADALEAVIGAVYLSVGTEAASEFVLRLMQPLLEQAANLSGFLDPKTTLQELAAAQSLPHPQYTVVGEGPDHNRRYTATVSVLGVTARGEGSSKKAAELAAARRAVTRIHALQAAKATAPDTEATA